MKKIPYIIFLLGIMNIFAQTHDRNMSFTEIDTTIVSGTAIVVEADLTDLLYFLDEDGDGVAEYHLNFGPKWYIPDSSDAVRPINGESISIVGGLKDSSMMDESIIIVYEINGLFWRDPFFSYWNNMGHRDHKARHHNSRRGFGWKHDKLEITTLTGTALVDSTFYMNHYYLDTNNDSLPDYFLNFGPFWFQPKSGAIRPEDGETIKIVGGQIETSITEPVIVVFEINGLVWRDSASIGKHFGGGWIDGNMDSSRTFHSPFDNSDKIKFYPGWNKLGGSGHMGGGSRLPDSLFCQLFEIAPENISKRNNMNVFASYEVNMLTPDGSNLLMSSNMIMGNKIKLGNNADFHLHYTDLQMKMYDGNEDEIIVNTWDDITESWITIDAVVDTDNNTVDFSSSEASNLIILSTTKATDINHNVTNLPTEFTLSQNYPNPFNPSTQIEFSLKNITKVTLNVYNIVGEKVATLVNENMDAGSYIVNFDASNFSSGVYFYELKADANRLVKKMTLLK